MLRSHPFSTRNPALIAGLLLLMMLTAPIQGTPPKSLALPELPASLASTTADFGQLPLYFVENRGQTDAQVAYYIQGRDKTIYFTPEGVTFALAYPTGDAPTNYPGADFDLQPASDDGEGLTEPVSERWVVKLDFVGADPNARPMGQDPAETVVSYFTSPREQWQTGLHTFTRLVYQDLWPGIDLAYTGTQDSLKYEFVVQPGADPTQIRLAYRGVSSLSTNAAGQLVVATPAGELLDETPLVYQVRGDMHEMVNSAYAVDSSRTNEALTYGFRVGAYDANLPLVIDPAMLIYAGYFGGSNWDHGYGIAVDGAGNAYVTGVTPSDQTTFPVVGGPDSTHNGGVDVFIVKVNAAGTGLIYAGYIGGSSGDTGYGIAVDGVGNAYVTGTTSSSQATFPVVGGPDLTYNGSSDAFVAKVNAAGTGLVYSGYIGGSNDDDGDSIAVDAAGNAYVFGRVKSDQTTFPVVVGPDLTFNGGLGDAFVAKVNAAGTELDYAGYIGGSGDDNAGGIAVDEAGNAYLAGTTSSDQTTFPVVGGPDLTFNGVNDAFVAKVNAAGTGLAYAGYIGGSGSDGATDIALDAGGNVYVAGGASSNQTTFPVVGGPDLTFNGVNDAFVAKVNAAGTGLVYSGYIGGSGSDSAQGVAVDAAGNAYVAGSTFSDQTTFPVIGGPDLTFNGGGYDAFVAKVNAAGTGLVYSGYIGGSSGDNVLGIAVDGVGNAYVTGDTASDQVTFPVVGGPDLTFNGGYDGFVAKVWEEPTYSITGRVTDNASQPVSGAVVSAGAGLSATTDASGYYTLTSVLSGTYTITPTLAGYTFNPTSRQVSVPPDAVAQDFTGTAIVSTSSIAGRISTGAGAGLAGVVVSNGAGLTVTTTTSGYYTFTNIVSGSYTLTPVLPGYTFAPASHTVNVPPDAFLQNFTATALVSTSTITGRITTGAGAGLAGVLVSNGAGLTITTTTSGHYTITNVASGSYTLSPVLADYTFTPTSRGVNVPPDATGQDFVGLESIDLGFRPNPDGYNFANYGGVNTTDFTISDMRQMFGDEAVCWVVEGLCIPKPAALAWNLKVNSQMSGGRCEGFTTTSLRFFRELDSQSAYQANADDTYDLQLSNIRRRIAYYWTLQLPEPARSVIGQATLSSPSQVLEQLSAALSGAAVDPINLHVYNSQHTSGHSIAPYAIEERGDGTWWVRVYDNNFPDDLDRYVVITPTVESWSYDMGGSTTWVGDGATHSLGAVPISVYDEEPVCPWCTDVSGDTNESGQVWYSGQGHLLITDAHGRRLGYVGDQFVSEIPGAFGSVLPGGLGVPHEPIYTLPLTGTYMTLLDGQTLTQTGSISVTQFGPGYAISVNNATLTPTSQDQLLITPDGVQVAYRASIAQHTSLMMATDGVTASHEFEIMGVAIGAGQVVTLTNNVVSSQLALSNAQAGGGVYDLKATRVTDTGEQLFSHAGIASLATDTHYVNYGDWDGSGPMTVLVDHGSDGTIDTTVILTNQATTQLLYLPLITK